jgi:hypothetical protein
MEGQRVKKLMSSFSLLFSRILIYLARLGLPRSQRLILLLEISWASQRLSAQLSPGFYLLRLRRRPFGPKI